MKNKNDVFIFGLAIFAMFFGAGNLIFPAGIGLVTGREWLMSSAGFFLTGICLPVGGLMAFSRAGSIHNFADKVSERFNTLYFSLMILALGPMLAIPRTAATAYEMGIAPNFGDINPLLASVCYFIVVYILVIKPSQLLNNIGKYMTPIILTILALIIGKGILSGFGVPGKSITPQNSFSYGFFGGYQTMDAIASVIFGTVIAESLRGNGYTDEREQSSMIVKSGIIAGIGMAVVYGGLLYLGAMANGNGLNLGKAELVMYFAETSLGSVGVMALGMCVTVACLTTSIALVATVSNFFAEKTRFSYRTITIATCAISSVLGATGIGFMVDIAVPVLTILYPVTIILIVLNIFKVENAKIYRTGVATGLLFSVLEVIADFNISSLVTAHFNTLPLASEGFAWLIPTLLASLAAGLVKREKLAVAEVG